MQNKTGNLFYRRKEQYRSLKSLLSAYSSNFTINVDTNTLYSTVLFLQVLTGRTDSAKKAPIQQDGFEFTNKYLKLEKSFLEHQGLTDKTGSKG